MAQTDRAAPCAKRAVLALAIALVACAPESKTLAPDTANGGVSSMSASGSSATSPSAGSPTVGGQSGRAAGGSVLGGGGAGGVTPAMPEPDGGEPSVDPITGGTALLVTGTIPLLGTDVVFEKTLKAHGLEVEVIQESEATPLKASGKRLVILSYGMSSTAFDAESFADVAVPIILTEQNLLPRLKMSTVHGFTDKMAAITITSDHALAAGFPAGDVEVYSPAQELFYGSPGADGIKIASILGHPEQITYFAYEAGATMVDNAVAPAKRIQFFHATHSPDPIDANLYLNDNGLELLDAAVSWCLE